jgi:two-component system CheB/CheR fusion protein
MDGYALLRKVREGKLNKVTPAIAVTGYNRPKDVERATREGFAAHLSKPVTVVELIDTILRVANNKKS